MAHLHRLQRWLPPKPLRVSARVPEHLPSPSELGKTTTWAKSPQTRNARASRITTTVGPPCRQARRGSPHQPGVVLTAPNRVVLTNLLG